MIRSNSGLHACVSCTLPVLEEGTVAIGEAGPVDLGRWAHLWCAWPPHGRFRDYPMKVSAWSGRPEGSLGNLPSIKWKHEWSSKSQRVLTSPRGLVSGRAGDSQSILQSLQFPELSKGYSHWWVLQEEAWQKDSLGGRESLLAFSQCLISSIREMFITAPFWVALPTDIAHIYSCLSKSPWDWPCIMLFST